MPLSSFASHSFGADSFGSSSFGGGFADTIVRGLVCGSIAIEVAVGAVLNFVVATLGSPEVDITLSGQLATVPSVSGTPEIVEC